MKTVKISIWSSIIVVDDMLKEVISEANSKINESVFQLVEMKYRDLLSAIIDLLMHKKTSNIKEIYDRKEVKVNNFVELLCRILPDIVMFGPFIPCIFDEGELVKEIIKKFPACHEAFNKNHTYEIWRHDHEVRFMPIFQIESEKTKKELLKLGISTIMEINCSLTNNKQKILEYLSTFTKEKIPV